MFCQPMFSQRKTLARSTRRKIALIAALLAAAGSWAVAKENPQHSFGGESRDASNSALDAASQGPTVSKLILIPSSVVGGSSAKARVWLSAAAPTAGALVHLTVSNHNEVSIPASVLIPAGRRQATIAMNSLPVSVETSVTVIAKYKGSFAGAALTVLAAGLPGFSVSLQPASVSLDPGSSATTNLVTQVTGGFNQALSLNATQVPAGITLSFSPSLIPAPGAGTSVVSVTADASAAAGSYPITVSAGDGTVTHSVTLTVTVNDSSSGIVGPLQGCLHKANGHGYQAVEFSMEKAGTVTFDAYLYYGATCDPNQQADRFGFGQTLSLGGFGYVFWFRDFADQTNTSAIWYIGNRTLQCVDYTKVPDC